MDTESETWVHDITSWDALDRGQAGASWGAVDGESEGVQGDESCGASGAVSWGVQSGGSLHGVGGSLDEALVSHGSEGELSSLGSSCSKGSGSPIT